MSRSVFPVPQSCTSSLAICDSVWMDDLALLHPVPAANLVIPHLSVVAGTLVDCCLRRGLHPSLDRNKTEAMLTVKGTGSRAVRRDHLSLSEPLIPINSHFWRDARIRVVPRYRHLGGVLHHRASSTTRSRPEWPRPGARSPRASASSFSQRGVALRDELVLLRTLVCTVLLFGSGTWPTLCPSDLHRLRMGYVGLCRALLRPHFRGDANRLTEDRVLALCGAPSIDSLLHAERLTYLRSFMELNVPEAWALAHAQQQWLGLVRGSLEWLWRNTEGFREFQGWEQAWEEWRPQLLQQPRTWKRRIRRAVESATRREHLAEAWQQCRGMFLRTLQRAGVTTRSGGRQPGDAPPDCPFFCGPCSRLFPTKQRWAVHAFSRHGRVKETRCLVSGEQCPVCLRQFSCHVVLCQHLDYSVRCRHRLQAAAFSCRPGPGVGNRQADRGHSFMGVAKQALGPFDPRVAADMPPPGQPPPRALQIGLTSFLSSPCGDAVEALERLRGALAADCVTPPELELALSWGLSHAGDIVESLDVRSAHFVLTALRWAAESWTPQWLCGSDTPVEHCQALFRNSAQLLSEACFAGSLVDSQPRELTRAGLLICGEAEAAGFTAEVPGWHATLLLHQLPPDGSWVDQVHRYAVIEEGSGLTVISLACLPSSGPLPDGLLPFQVFSDCRYRDTLTQDAYLLAVQLWRVEAPFALLLPVADWSIAATARRLPGVAHHVAGRLQLLYTCRSEDVPCCLFHTLIRCHNPG